MSGTTWTGGSGKRIVATKSLRATPRRWRSATGTFNDAWPPSNRRRLQKPIAR